MLAKGDQKTYTISVGAWPFGLDIGRLINLRLEVSVREDDWLLSRASVHILFDG